MFLKTVFAKKIYESKIGLRPVASALERCSRTLCLVEFFDKLQQKYENGWHTRDSNAGLLLEKSFS